MSGSCQSVEGVPRGPQTPRSYQPKVQDRSLPCPGTNPTALKPALWGTSFWLSLQSPQVRNFCPMPGSEHEKAQPKEMCCPLKTQQLTLPTPILQVLDSGFSSLKRCESARGNRKLHLHPVRISHFTCCYVPYIPFFLLKRTEGAHLISLTISPKSRSPTDIT